MAKQTTPHTQTQQNVNSRQTDMEPDQVESEIAGDADIYVNMAGAETGGDRAPERLPGRATQHNTEPASEAHQGSLSTRAPKKASQGITSRSANEESARQEKVVNQRPDAQSGVNRSKH